MAQADLSMTPQRVILVAAGEQRRWKNHMGTAKHLVQVDGEPILHRSVRLFGEYTDDIWVVGLDDRYDVPGSTWFRPVLHPEWGGADKFLSSRDLWLENGRTIVAFGDVYFTEHAVQRIMTESHRDWLIFARPYGSFLTGCAWGEIFATGFYNEHIAEFARALDQAVECWGRREIMVPSAWSIYRMMLGLPKEFWDRHVVGDRMIRIDDWTEDFDFPTDYDRWLDRWNQR